jgi:glucose-1-phosphate cytidylyltransferase
MKCIILAGGLGTRLSEETQARPKPMVEIGGKPILWHIMKIYAAHGIREFIVCCGYKGYVIKEYFANYALHMSDVTFDMSENNVTVHQRYVEPWRVSLIDTGDDTNTGGRLLAVSDYIRDEKAFCLTYGDGVADIDIGALVAFHWLHGRSATITAVQPPGRYGRLEIVNGVVEDFIEKPKGDGDWINGGFFVLSPDVLNHIGGPTTSWESDTLKKLAHERQLQAFKHPGFWQPMDTLRDMRALDQMWVAGKAPWKVW